MGSKQLGFGDYEQTTAKKRTRRERFLAEMEVVVPWKALIDLIEPHYPKATSKGGRPPYPLETMLRIHLLQQWYDLSDPAMEDALIEVPTMRRFAGIELISDRIPDETTILAFRHLLEKHELGDQIFGVVKAHLKANGMAIKQGTIIDATLIAAPSSTKNEKGKRDPEMHQTKKGNQWYFGMKVHIGVDKDTGLIHSVETTAANVHDLTPAADLLHGEETVVSSSERAWLAEGRNSRLPRPVGSGIGGPGSRCRRGQGSQGAGDPPADTAGWSAVVNPNGALKPQRQASRPVRRLSLAGRIQGRIGIMVLAKRSSDNQLTLPQAVVELLGPADVYDVICEEGRIVITPISSSAASAVRSRLEEQGLREEEVVAAVSWARQA
jgi:IS5 family transposase